MRFSLRCEDEASVSSFQDLTLSQVMDEAMDHLAAGYKIEARPVFETSDPPPKAKK